ncbi:MAG: anti-sigma factor domain-containing protein [Oleiphilus sp.]
MNYLKPELLEHLASEYVLGTMPRRSRRRFDRIMMDSYRARQAVWDWEQRINPLAQSVESVEPPKHAWKNIQQRIHPAKAEAKSFSLTWWQSWSALSTAFALVLALFIALQPTPSAMQDQIALFNDDAAQPLWLVTGSSESGQLSIKPINAKAVAIDDKAFELWMLPTAGSPKSLGLMPVSNQATKMVLSPQLLGILQQSQGLAVSIEPRGGSPTGLPTGPVVYQAPLIAF